MTENTITLYYTKNHTFVNQYIKIKIYAWLFIIQNNSLNNLHILFIRDIY